ncbi:MAG: pyridoxal phosphate-dependent aminotransferase [Planctomycetota bacterium]
MPQVPHTSQGSASLPASTFVAFRDGILAHAAAGTLIPLHLGDTRLLPPAAARALDLEDRALHRYGPVAGFPELRAAVAQDFTRAGLAVDVADVAITPGATGALDVALDMVLDPGEETLVLTPSWPLIFGIASRRGVLRQVPLSPGGELPDPETLAARVAAAITPRTAAIYWSDPNNPVGFCYSDAHRDALYALAEAHGLWVVIDAVYSDLVFSGSRSPSRPTAARRARTFVAVSYSKRFGLAGHRVGALATPPGLGELAARLVTYTTYHASHAGQHMALDVFRDDPDAPRQAWHDLARAVRPPAPRWTRPAWPTSAPRAARSCSSTCGPWPPTATPPWRSCSARSRRRACPRPRRRLRRRLRPLRAAVLHRRQAEPGHRGIRRLGRCWGRWARRCAPGCPLAQLACAHHPPHACARAPLKRRPTRVGWAQASCAPTEE